MMKYPKRYELFKRQIDSLDKDLDKFKYKLKNAKNLLLCINTTEIKNQDIQHFFTLLNSSANIDDTITIDVPSRIESKVDIFGYFGTDDTELLLGNKSFENIYIFYCPKKVYYDVNIDFWSKLNNRLVTDGHLYLMYNRLCWNGINNFIEKVESTIGLKSVNIVKDQFHLTHHLTGELCKYERIFIIFEKR